MLSSFCMLFCSVHSLSSLSCLHSSVWIWMAFILHTVISCLSEWEQIKQRKSRLISAQFLRLLNGMSNNGKIVGRNSIFSSDWNEHYTICSIRIAARKQRIIWWNFNDLLLFAGFWRCLFSITIRILFIRSFIFAIWLIFFYDFAMHWKRHSIKFTHTQPVSHSVREQTSFGSLSSVQ